MKKNYFIIIVIIFSLFSFGQTKVFINEIHYDNAGADADEGIEIAGPSGNNLSSYTFTLLMEITIAPTKLSNFLGSFQISLMVLALCFSQLFLFKTARQMALHWITMEH